ncbi:MAG TPA: YXWGXW repeat-containing protein [Gammaproteobacteria bacterium]|nr:YXWGXW repeat-containing protein [Gammaproteobacteria bacterium]
MKRATTILLVAISLIGPLLVLPDAAVADVETGTPVSFAPPPLPYYSQPFCPGMGFVWMPGYWAYSDAGYFWVPGTWVLAPAVGMLWTPGWWGWYGGRYWWHRGYWGPHVGYYGGIHYGYGYPGEGYEGGYWRDQDFYYNRAVNNVSSNITGNTYYQRMPGDANSSRVSYNGGAGGITTQPTGEQQQFARDQHFSDTEAQLEQESIAMNDPAQRWSVNHGKPRIAATTRPGEFNGAGTGQMNQKQTAHLDPPAAHATPGQPGFQRAQRTEIVSVPKPAEPRTDVTQQPSQATLPESSGFRNETQIQQPRQVRTKAPHMRQPATEFRGGLHRPVKANRGIYHDDRVGRPPH